MHRLLRILEKPGRNAIGLMSGSSADAIDAAWVRIEGSGRTCRIEFRGFESCPYSEPLRRRVLDAGRADARHLAELDRVLGEAFAESCLRAAKKWGLSAPDIDLIGSHGQTVFHHSGRGPRTSLQFADGDRIAEGTGAIVVSDFRQRDLAAGGEGAPISAWPDYLLFGRSADRAAVLNLGGIANLTIFRGGPEDLIAFDAGPANMVIDGLVAWRTDGKERCDRDGRIAASGRPLPELLAWMLGHPFLQVPPPKSTGRETFGEEYLGELLRRSGRAAFPDLLATATLFTAKTVALAVRGFSIRELIVGGGGVRNPTLMDLLRRELDPLPVVETTKYGIPPEARECVAMAILANETAHGLPGNHPGATGAARPVPLGKISL